MSIALHWLRIFWPFIILLASYLFFKKQNSSTAWTGGNISPQKSLWLFYTVLTWFLYPFLLILDPQIETYLQAVIIIHLISWWTRGPIELFMIYKWLNWKPLYGISHSIFHLFLMISASIYFMAFQTVDTPFSQICQLFIISVFISTTAEIFFALTFSKIRSESESKQNIYFASSSKKWNAVNRATSWVVVLMICLLLLQSSWPFIYDWNDNV